MLVKICGIQTLEAAETAANHGANFLGFVFAESKRRITPEAAVNISKKLPSTVKKVGVFVNESLESMLDIAEKVGLEVIQLHGDEPSEIARALPYEIIKAFPATREKQAEIQNYPCDYYLLDTPTIKQRGGTGRTFDWSIIAELNLDHRKLFLAGGLTPENVETAIKHTNPVAVDVSSGVETNGEKDHIKIKQFINHAKGGQTE